jgi:hypothetical protein
LIFLQTSFHKNYRWRCGSNHLPSKWRCTKKR